MFTTDGLCVMGHISGPRRSGRGGHVDGEAWTGVSGCGTSNQDKGNVCCECCVETLAVFTRK